MAKHRSPRNENQASTGKSLTVEVPLPVLGVLGETREAFHELYIRTGQQVLLAWKTLCNRLREDELHALQSSETAEIARIVEHCPYGTVR